MTQIKRACSMRRPDKGLSLLEVMIAMVIFVLIFTFTFKAFAPTATDAHSMLRGVTVAMNACNWYLNELEQKINYNGGLPDSELGENNITHIFKDLNADDDMLMFSDLLLLRNLMVTSDISLDGNLYQMTVQFKWGRHDRDHSRPHGYKLSRLKTRPGF